MEIPMTLPSNGLLGYSKDVVFPEWDFDAILSFSKVVENNLMLEYCLYLDRVCKSLPEGGAVNFATEDLEYMMVMQRVNSLPNGSIYRFSFNHSDLISVKEKDETGKYVERLVNKCGYQNNVVVDLKKIKVNELKKGEFGLEFNNSQYFFSVPSFKKKQNVIDFFKDSLKIDIVNSSNITAVELQLFVLMSYLTFIKVETEKEPLLDMANLFSICKTFSPIFVQKALEGINKYFSNFGLEMNVSGICEGCKKQWSFRFPFLEGFFAVEV